MQPRWSRRGFLGAAGKTGAALGAASTISLGAAPANAAVRDPDHPLKRAAEALKRRLDAAAFEARHPIPRHPDNGDDDRYPNRIASYSKGLPHNERGEVDPAAYDKLLVALSSGRAEDFARIPLGGPRKLVHPQGSLTFEVFGPDSHALAIPPAPAFASAEMAGEMVELYWMALLRDVPLTNVDSDPGVAAACAELSNLSDFRGPRQAGRVTPQTLFRMDLPGCLTGPFVSQFLVRDVAIGALNLVQQIKAPTPVDYLTNVADWLGAQRGGPPLPTALDATPRFIRSGRDLAQAAHIDVVYQNYWHALLLLLRLGATPDAANPYVGTGTGAANQQGNGLFGPPHVASLMGAVAQRATKAVWFQKWGVHRRLRPEMMGGRVHGHATGVAAYPIHPELTGSDAVDRTFSRHGSFLLPQAYGEGSPVHPSYSGGHAVLAGACVTVLKAFFDEGFVLPASVVPNADGSALLPWTGPALTVGGELNKLAMNVAIGRNLGGIHYRSDALQSLLLGEEVAIRLLREDKFTVTESFRGFSLTRFDGTTIVV